MLKPSTIAQSVEALFPAIVTHRRQLHAYPELSFKEYKTAKYLAEVLESWEVDFEPIAETGLVAYIKGGNPGRVTVALRADIDALPIAENNATTYASQNDGVMHACGHDVHTASMLGVVAFLMQNRDAFEGTFKVIFQPGEEQAPGGANKIIEAGGLQDPTPHVIFGQHVHPELPAGHVGMRTGPFMASSDEIRVTIEGKGGHAAMPHKLVDPVVVASHLVISLQQLVSRMTNPTMPCVLSFGRIQGDGSNNVIPDMVYLEGTFRTFDEQWREEALAKIRHMVHNLSSSMGAGADVGIKPGYPALENGEAVTKRARQAAEDFLGSEYVHTLPPRPTAEDFAFYLQEIPGCFYRIGVADPSNPAEQHDLHTNRFDIDEESLKTGVGVMAYVALQEMAYQVQNHANKNQNTTN